MSYLKHVSSYDEVHFQTTKKAGNEAVYLHPTFVREKIFQEIVETTGKLILCIFTKLPFRDQIYPIKTFVRIQSEENPNWVNQLLDRLFGANTLTKKEKEYWNPVFNRLKQTIHIKNKKEFVKVDYLNAKQKNDLHKLTSYLDLMQLVHGLNSETSRSVPGVFAKEIDDFIKAQGDEIIRANSLYSKKKQFDFLTRRDIRLILLHGMHLVYSQTSSLRDLRNIYRILNIEECMGSDSAAPYGQLLENLRTISQKITKIRLEILSTTLKKEEKALNKLKNNKLREVSKRNHKERKGIKEFYQMDIYQTFLKPLGFHLSSLNKQLSFLTCCLKSYRQSLNAQILKIKRNLEKQTLLCADYYLLKQQNTSLTKQLSETPLTFFSTPRAIDSPKASKDLSALERTRTRYSQLNEAITLVKMIQTICKQVLDKSKEMDDQEIK